MQMNFSAIEGHVRGLLGPTATEPHRHAMGFKVMCLLPLMVCLLWGMHTSLAQENPSVVTFNQEVINRQFVNQLSQYNVSDEMIRVKTDAFKKALDEALRDYAAKHHALVMQQKNVMAGGQDVTDAILQLIAARMKASS
jgi:type-F conjugative transfer system protein TrbI